MSNKDQKMTKVALNGYKNNAIQILQTQIKMLSDIESEILSKEQETKADDTKIEGILTSETCKEFQQILQGEVHKLQKFDVVLAVVGTMKAGKSTTINAIVGREILPNRNRPMTSLPTLICHNKQQETPKLKFNSDPINEFLIEVKQALDVCDIENPSPEIIELINFIKSNSKFGNNYHGEANIFEFLQRLNDLVRLTTTINDIADKEVLTFPYERYKNIDSLPIIDVAFKLEDNFDTEGRFMLLDTAGPNESGHKELLGLLREQLKRSSAVMLVLDYTQLNSEAEESIKNEIDTIPTIQKSRLFALVNKFDQESANADDAETTKKHIYNNLLKDKIDFEHIYPISARDAYLANRMESYLSRNNKKPEYKEGTWIEDFAKQVLGKRAEQKYDRMDEEDIVEELKALIDESRMAEPLTDVIQKMQKNAPYIAIQSALAGASDVFEKLHNFFNIRGHFAEKEKMTDNEIAQLEQTIKDLKAQITNLSNMSKNIKEDFEGIKVKAKEKMKKKEQQRKVMVSLSETLDEMFDIETKRKEKVAKQRNERTRGGLSTHVWFDFLNQKRERKRNKLEELEKARQRAKSTQHSLIFDSKSDVNTFKRSLMANVADLIAGVTHEYHAILEESIEDTQKVTESLYDECNLLLDSLQEEFNKEGIKEIKIKDIDARIEENREDVLDAFSINYKNTSRTETREKSGSVSKVTRFFGRIFDTDWGTYEVKVETYTVSKKGMHDELRKLIENKVIKPLRVDIEKALTEFLESNIESIGQFNQTIENVVSEMNNAIIQEKMPDLEGKRLYKKKIKTLQRTSHDIEDNWVHLSDKFSVEKIDTQTKADVAVA